MLDVHPPHGNTHSWTDFFIHIATICVGLLIAVGLEQTVELVHHHHQQERLQEDLRAEAENNRQVIARDLKITDMEPWFVQAAKAVDAASVQQARVHLTLPRLPCLPGTIGTAEYRYFAPSEAVWATARESGLVYLLPVEQSRMYARLAHNYDLLSGDREDVYRGCNALVAMASRFSHNAPGAAASDWTMTPEQAETFAATAASERIAIKSLSFRLRWSDLYEEALIDGENKVDVHMMTMNQERFEDDEDQTATGKH